MDRSKENNYAFIDSQNLNLSIRALGWALDFKRFRKYLLEKYSISEAFLFIGFVEGNNDLYKSLQEAGFICIFKPTLKYKDGTTKGNCDADLVLKATRDAYENAFGKAILVSSDGDYAGLVKFLLEKNKFLAVVSPAIAKKCSILLKRTGVKISYLHDQRSLLEL